LLLLLLTSSLQVTNASTPGDYVITSLVKKDMRMTNVTITTRPVAAPLLQLPFNASLHQEVTAGQQPPAVVPVHSIEELAVSLQDIHRCAAA
jgi:hypothetical protein